jgi:hypothetical protein
MPGRDKNILFALIVQYHKTISGPVYGYFTLKQHSVGDQTITAALDPLQKTIVDQVVDEKPRGLSFMTRQGEGSQNLSNRETPTGVFLEMGQEVVRR